MRGQDEGVTRAPLSWPSTPMPIFGILRTYDLLAAPTAGRPFVTHFGNRALSGVRSPDDRRVTPRFAQRAEVWRQRIKPGDGGAVNLHPIEALVDADDQSIPLAWARKDSIQSSVSNRLRQCKSPDLLLPTRTACTSPMTTAWVWRVTISSTRQSNEASESTRAGAPVSSADQSPSSNRASPSTPLPPAKREASAPCWAARIFTAKVPACVSTASVDEERSRQITSEGGDRESEASAVAVQPARSFPFAHVTIATPEANSRIATRKSALLASGCTALIASASLQGHHQLAGAHVSVCSRQRKQMGSRRHAGVAAYEGRTSLDRSHEG